MSNSTSLHPEENIKLLQQIVLTLGQMNAQCTKMESIPFPAWACGEIGRDFASVATQVRAALLDSLLKLMILSYRFCEDADDGTRKLQRSSSQFADDLRRVRMLQDVTNVNGNIA